MAHRIRWCPACEKYTMHEHCPECGERALRKSPPRYSPEDRYGRYRRMLQDEAAVENKG